MLVGMKEIVRAFWTIPNRGQSVAINHRMVFFIIIASYLPVVWGLQRYMKSRPAFKLKWVAFGWNMSLAILSAAGVILVMSDDWRIVFSLFVEEIAYNPRTRSVMALFSLTKPLEFGDTFILVLKKKPVIFLHLYHHFTVALYCWHAQYVNVQFAHPFAIMNLAIHAVMYMYYAAAVVMPRHRVLAAVRPFITQSQTLQMVVGMYIAINVILKAPAGQLTDGQVANAWYSLVMYCTYVYLFGKFYLENYVKVVRPVMTLVIGTLHVVAIVGIALWWSHARRLRIGLELLIGYLMTTVFLYLSNNKEYPYLDGPRTPKNDSTAAPGKLNECVQNDLSKSRQLASGQDSDSHHAESPCGESRIHWLTRAGSMIFNTWAAGAQQLRVFKLRHELQCSDQDDSTPRGDVSPSLVRTLVDKTSSEREKSTEDRSFLLRHFDPWFLPLCILVPALYGFYSHRSFFLGISVHGCLRWVLELYTTDAVMPNLKVAKLI